MKMDGKSSGLRVGVEPISGLNDHAVTTDEAMEPGSNTTLPSEDDSSTEGNDGELIPVPISQIYADYLQRTKGKAARKVSVKHSGVYTGQRGKRENSPGNS